MWSLADNIRMQQSRLGAICLGPSALARTLAGTARTTVVTWPAGTASTVLHFLVRVLCAHCNCQECLLTPFHASLKGLLSILSEAVAALEAALIELNRVVMHPLNWLV